MTQRIYYENSYISEFDAKILEQYHKGDHFAVILDQTAFYPTSGGQMRDNGFLENQTVLDVLEEGEEIAHLVDTPFSSQKVHGKINWQRRFDFMQQHTAFHILAQSFLQELRIDTVSSHLGESKDTIDIACPNLTWAQVRQVENSANQIVAENRNVRSFWIDRNEIEKLPLRKLPQFLNKPIRLVEIDRFDLDPCGGTHVANTGEVGIIKILCWEKVRGIIRCTFVAGRRALHEYQVQTEIITKIKQVLSATEEEMIIQVEALKTSDRQQNKQIKKLKSQILEFEAKQLISQRQLTKELLWVEEFSNKTPTEIRYLAINVSRELPVITVFYSRENPVTMVIARSDSLVYDLREIISQLKELLQAKGGGSEKLIELNHFNPNQISLVIEKTTEFINKNT